MSDQPKDAIQRLHPEPGGAIRPDDQLLRDIMADVERLVARHGWETTPQRRAASLLRETIELAEEVLQLSGAGPYDAVHQQRIGREIYHVLWNTCDLARLTGIDLVEAAADKRNVNERRTWLDAAP